jgi:hypothetical protein
MAQLQGGESVNAMSMHEGGSDGAVAPEAASEELPLAVEELVRAAIRLVMGSAGIAVASASRWQRRPAGEGSGAAAGAGNLASAALGLGLATERVVVRGASAVGGTAASVTWGVVHASPLRGPIERLAERFRGEQRLSEQEVSDAAAAILTRSARPCSPGSTSTA